MVLPRRDRVVVASALSPAAAVEQLRVGRIGNRWYPHFTATQGLRPVIVGTVTADRVHVAVTRANRRNPWRPVLRGRFLATPDGTEFVGSFGLATSTRAFTAGCLGGLAALLVMASLLAGSAPGRDLAAVVVSVVGMAALGTALSVAGTAAARGDQQIIRDWLTEQLGRR
jgi:hypothetical protein